MFSRFHNWISGYVTLRQHVVDMKRLKETLDLTSSNSHHKFEARQLWRGVGRQTLLRNLEVQRSRP